MTVTTTAEDPAEIEREIRRTQENMSSTVDKIGDQLSIKNVFNALLDKADDSNVDMRMLLDGARRNPVALGLIAAGAIWLVSEKDAKLPSLGSKAPNDTKPHPVARDDDHGHYISHMSTIEQNADEDAAGYQRRRDNARANYFMVEREQDEEDSSFRKRLDTASEKFRQKRHDFANSAGQARGVAMEKAQAAGHKAQNLYADNPLVGGILAMAVGAAFGSALPTSRREQESLGSLGEKARDAVGAQTEKITDKVREKKDEVLDKADAALAQSSKSTAQTNDPDNERQEADASFMIGR